MTTPNLGLPAMLSTDAQKELTFNDAMNVLDAVAPRTVISRTVTTPPATPTDGMVYVVGVGATGIWAGKDNQIAYFAGGWFFLTAQEQWCVGVQDEKLQYAFSTGVWNKLVLQAQGFDFRKVWTPNTPYLAYDVVTYAGQTYEAPISFISGDTFNPANWILWAQKGADGTGGTGGSGTASIVVAAPEIVQSALTRSQAGTFSVTLPAAPTVGNTLVFLLLGNQYPSGNNPLGRAIITTGTAAASRAYANLDGQPTTNDESTTVYLGASVYRQQVDAATGSVATVSGITLPGDGVHSTTIVVYEVSSCGTLVCGSQTCVVDTTAKTAKASLSYAYSGSLPLVAFVTDQDVGIPTFDSSFALSQGSTGLAQCDGTSVAVGTVGSRAATITATYPGDVTPTTLAVQVNIESLTVYAKSGTSSSTTSAGTGTGTGTVTSGTPGAAKIALLEKADNQGIPAGGYHTIYATSTVYDTIGMVSAASSAQAGVIQFPPGTKFGRITWRFDYASGQNYIDIRLVKNTTPETFAANNGMPPDSQGQFYGSTLFAGAEFGGSWPATSTISAWFQVADGDVFYLGIYCGSGGSIGSFLNAGAGWVQLEAM